jgi:hypothetical protein
MNKHVNVTNGQVKVPQKKNGEGKKKMKDRRTF